VVAVTAHRLSSQTLQPGAQHGASANMPALQSTSTDLELKEKTITMPKKEEPAVDPQALKTLARLEKATWIVLIGLFCSILALIVVGSVSLLPST